MAEQGALEACAEVAMQRGAFAKLDAKDASANATTPATSDQPAKLHFAAEHNGFNVHAGVHIAAGDDMGRERLFRYGARPALALDRLRHLPGGRIAYRVKYAAAGRAKHRVMTALELLARIAALLPPPRFPFDPFSRGARASFVVAPGSRAAAPRAEAVRRAEGAESERRGRQVAGRRRRGSNKRSTCRSTVHER